MRKPRFSKRVSEKIDAARSVAPGNRDEVDAFLGLERTKVDTCERCEGTGREDWPPERQTPKNAGARCYRCEGSGVEPERDTRRAEVFVEFDIEDGDYRVWVRRSGETVEMSLVDRSEYENAASAELSVDAIRQLRDALTAVLDAK